MELISEYFWNKNGLLIWIFTEYHSEKFNNHTILDDLKVYKNVHNSSLFFTGWWSLVGDVALTWNDTKKTKQEYTFNDGGKW